VYAGAASRRNPGEWQGWDGGACLHGVDLIVQVGQQLLENLISHIRGFAWG
jgi:hypothetical protein